MNGGGGGGGGGSGGGALISIWVWNLQLELVSCSAIGIVGVFSLLQVAGKMVSWVGGYNCVYVERKREGGWLFLFLETVGLGGKFFIFYFKLSIRYFCTIS